MAPATPGPSHQPQEKHSIQWSTVEYGRPHGSKALRNHTYSYSQISTARRSQTQTLPPRVENQAGTPTQHALVPVTPTTHHETTNKNGTQVTTESNLSSTTLARTSPIFRFADDILLVSGSLKHTTTMLDKLIAATTAHGLQLHTRKRKSSPTRHQNLQKRNTVAVQVLNIEIPPREGKTKYLGQLTPFKNAVQIELDTRIKCAGATFTSHRQELTSPTYSLRDRLKLFDATVTRSILHASGTRTVTDEMKKKLETTQRRMMRMIIQTKTSTGKCPAAAHAASVDNTAHAEHHDPHSEREDDATEPTHQGLNEHAESSDADSRPLLRRSSSRRSKRRAGTMG